MKNTVIKVENLGKSYIIGHEKQERYTALRDVMVSKAKNVLAKTKQIFKGGQLIAGNELEEFWALKDLNFEIKQGDRVGIIGRNGAGKSTLLKVLSRITEPTTGRVTIGGRVASLLEVGTGFHPELTGRENIFLNGAILGMSRFEIKKKFDEIIDFSGVEKFLDTPVKKYSSGMYVRLAFAVAAHLEPEILIVDEVLAVGDAEFQKKCLGKMEDVSTKEGRTVLFVSHNMGAISNLCNSAFVLQNGSIIYNGKTTSALDIYLNASQKKQYENLTKTLNINFQKAYINSHKNEFTTDETIKFTFEIASTREKKIDIGLAVLDRFRNKVFTSIYNLNRNSLKKDSFILICEIPEKFLAPGNYSIDVALFNGRIETYEYLNDILPFKIIDGGTNLSAFEGIFYGNVLCNCKWDVE